MTKKVIGLEEAVEDYRKARSRRWFHGSIMFDRKSNEVWTDFSYDEDMSWIRDIESGSIVNVSEMLLEDVMEGSWESAEISVENVWNYVAWKFSDEGEADEQH